MMPSLVLRGPALVLIDTYTATMPVRVGDALKITGEFRVAPTQSADDDVIGFAANSANINQPVDVAVAGLVQTITTGAIARGTVLVPSTDRGKAMPGSALDPKVLAGVKKHAVAAHSQVAGKPVWAHVRVLGG